MRDRSEAQVGGGSGADTGPHGSGLPPAGVAPGGGNDMASALAAALSARNKKVSHSGKFASSSTTRPPRPARFDANLNTDDEGDDDEWD